MLEAIASEAYATTNPDGYESLPFNRGGAYDLVVRGGMLKMPFAEPIRVDIAINYDDPVAKTGGTIREVGDLETAVSIDTLDVSGRFLHPGSRALAEQTSRIGDGGMWHWLRIGAPAVFIVTEGRDPGSRRVGIIP